MVGEGHDIGQEGYARLRATNYSVQMHANANAPDGSEAFIGLNPQAIDDGQPSSAVDF
jgi:hypothetical protein